MVHRDNSMRHGFISICAEVIMREFLESLALKVVMITTSIAAFISSIGLMMAFGFLNTANAEGLFVALEFGLAHQKHKSILCHSGSVSRNMNYGTEARAGYESGDFYTFVYYENNKCLFNGKIYDDERSRYIRSTEEELGFRIGLKVDL